MNKGTVLFCDNTLWGLLNFRGDVIKHFIGKGFNVVLVAPEKEDEQMRAQIPQNIKFISIKMGRTTTNPINDILYLIRLIIIYRKIKPDFVFNYTIKPNIYSTIAAKLNGSHTTAMMAGLGYTFKTNNIKTKIARMLYRIGLRFTDHLLLLNTENRDTIIKNKMCKPHKIIQLECGEGINLQKFKYNENYSEHTTFLFIGRVLWDKGYDEFVQAAKIVKDKYPKTKFHILGSLDPSYPQSVPLKRVKNDEKSGIIKYLGFTNNIQKIYEHKGIVVTLPSFYGEGLNRSLMEACASGKPIITTDIAGCRETVDEGTNGFIIKPKSPKELANAMIRFIELDEKEKRDFSMKSREKAVKQFDIKNVIKKYDDIINKNN